MIVACPSCGGAEVDFMPIAGEIKPMAMQLSDGSQARVLCQWGMCARGHRIAIPKLGARCTNCGHQDVVRAGNGPDYLPGGAAPDRVAAGQGDSSRGTLGNLARALGIPGTT